MCKCCNPKTDCRKVFGIPLAPVSLIFGCAIAAYEGWQIYETTTTTTWPNTTNAIALVLQCLILFVVVLGMISILAKWAKGVQFLVAGFRFVILAFAFSFIGMWIMWILNMYGVGMQDNVHWRPTKAEWISMGVSSAISVLLLITAWWAMSAFQSLRRVLAVGGTGWEGKNYREIKTGGKKTMVSSTSSSSDTV
eukprot:Protomagalhaensia_wolfi_Nauph_80__1731@NODE_2077_length_1222_cov_133_997464_g1622_i0_p1_GENE_NODE_2077_length_1222_cov_133_997464_g1622_i0NODE_2077_length_1222_cov_133_997464_g1622_i0_p1_ORF_typecomplete_len194_score27_29DUF3318/PF11780_8/0_38DUF3318/PF11780_8/4e02DUF3810/PF12725_7/0_36DUF1129/PF06570_11/0_66Prominin/PF05478_11/1_8DUF973/PF06157_11/1_1DUF973/PF06157_11/90Herpes_LMP1/PF05297_11/9_57TM_GPCR_Srab/PF10292_9/15DUF2070/PF09843_9/13_NODE_2077_length_1222_cov_133_997464_g1622_i05641145